MTDQEPKPIDTEDLKVYAEPEASIGPARFYFAKMGAIKGWRVLERIRSELGRTDVDVPGGEGEDYAQRVLRTVAALDPEFVEWLRGVLFAHVEFSNSSTTRQALSGAEDMAFEGLEPVAVYEVLLRSLAVNFFASLRDVLSRLGPEPEPGTSLPPL